MNFEAVRLLHAQGVSHRYITNQIYRPSDEEQQRRGSFILLFDQSPAASGAFLAGLTNTLIREYYRQSHQDALTSFEHTLIRLNEQLKSYLQANETSVTPVFNGVILLITEPEVHITYIGRPAAYLVRDDHFISLIEEAKEEDKPGSFPTFSVITSGEVQSNDAMILLTSAEESGDTKQDLQFALQHEPLYESGRAYARILKQQNLHETEGVFVLFGGASDSATIDQTVALDRSLETPGEKLADVEKKVMRHLGFIGQGVMFLTDKVSGGRVGGKKDYANEHGWHVEHATEDDSEQFAQFAEATDDSYDSAHDNSPVAHESLAVNHYQESDHESVLESDGSYQVKAYWQHDDPAPKKSVATVTPTVAVLEPSYEAIDDYPTKEDEAAITTLRASTGRFAFLQRLPVKPRTLYLLVGGLIVIFIIVRVVNSVTPHNQPAAIDTAQRDTYVTQAEASVRSAESAQVQGNNADAITNLLAAQTTLAKIPSNAQNDAAKALITRANDSLQKLTQTTTLTHTTTLATLTTTAKKVITTASATFVIDKDGTPLKLTDSKFTPLTSWPAATQAIDTTSANNGKQIAFLTQHGSTTGITLDTIATDTLQAISRSDGKAWSTAHLLASYDVNFYLVGDTMSKAIPQGSTYRVVSFSSDNTATLTSIVNNAGLFYAVDSSNQIVRLAANSTKTAVKLSGVPDSFLPKKIDRLLSPRDGTLYTLDTQGQRVLSFTTDGVYQGQYKLPTIKDATYTDCDTASTAFVCATSNKEVQSIPRS